MNTLILEFIGTVLICSTILYTNGNPLLVGIAYTSALSISKDSAYFSPLTILIQYMLRRMTLYNCFVNLAIQLSAALCVGLTYTHMPFIE